MFTSFDGFLLSPLVPDQELYKIACDKSGSRVIEAIFLSRTVLVKRKNKLIEKISVCFSGQLKVA